MRIPMRILLVVLCLAALPLTGAAQSDSAGFELFPHDFRFRPPVAGPTEPRMFLSRLEVKRDAGDFSAAYVGLGYDFGLLRRQSSTPDYGWQLSLFGSAESLFNLDLPGDALVNTDYRIGVPLTWRNGAFSMRGRVYHQSSHLGDELILGGNAPRRIELSFETVDFLAAWQFGGWRAYAGGAYVWRSSTPAYEGSTAHLGFDYVGSRGIIFGGRLTGGVDVKWLEQADWRSGVSAKLGLMVGRYSPDRRGFTIFLEAYDGFAPFGQFFVEDIKYYGATLQFDF
jgi:hypothetical protein